jgi:hypothetical protein
MDPMKLITYVIAIFVTVLMVIGGLGFYAGYSAGRRDISAVKAYIAAARLNLSAGKEGTPAATISLDPGALEPVMTELRALGASVAELQQRSTTAANGDGARKDEARSKDEMRLREELTQIKQKLADAVREDARLKDELAAFRQRVADGGKDASRGDPKLVEELSAARALVAQSASQVNACQTQVSSLESRLEAAARQPSGGAHGKGDLPSRQGNEAGASLLFYDSITLKRAQSKVYSDVDVTLSLESVAARGARVAINRQSVSINFGERKVFQHSDATCELMLMESDLESGQARFNITCKR